MKLKFVLVLTLLLSLISCSNDSLEKTDLQNDQKSFIFKKNNTTVNYLAKIEENNLKIQFSIDEVINESFIINLSNEDSSPIISNQITEKQKRLSKKFTLSNINFLSSIMDEMIEYETRNIKDFDLRNMKTQGLFICNSLVKSIGRLVKYNNSQYLRDGEVYTTNTVYKGYELELNSFVLNEDLPINVQQFIDNINQNPNLAQQKGFTFVLDILENKSVSEISFTELQNEILTFTANNPDLFEGEIDPNTGYRWPLGSDHGCCGNYSGYCWNWNPACYIHDVMCTDCTPRWFCFDGCVPD